jgi:sulfoacetaldehyde dehydrogenase
VVIVDEVYDAAIAALKQAGGYLCTPDEGERRPGTLWQDGKLNRHLIARSAPVLAEAFKLAPEARARSSSWWRKPASGAIFRCRAKSWRWC